MARLLSSALQATADLLLPVCCVSCERLMMPGESGIICGHCWSRCRRLPSPGCFRCGHPVGAYTCRWCELLPPFVRAARSYCWMGAGTGSAIVHALKYGGWIRVGPAMAERMSRLSWPADVVRERAGIVPVPLAPSRRRDRGFNQTEILATHLSQIWGVPIVDTALSRGHGTQSQTQLTPGERQGNVAGAFVVPHSARREVIGRHLVLLDDVVTTGSTLGACAKALFNAGARTISYMTFGRAPASGDRLIP